ncbi:MAG TPA: glycosyltransferase [Ignavibacteriaceae bacterium]|nr:glycosyltransferase [Ignavibacteriaceae bacterium]
MKILIITPRIPYPPYRGDKLKIFNISRILSKTNDVHIVTFYRNESDKELVKPIEELGIKVSLVRLTLLESIFNALLAIFLTTPFQVAWYKSSRMKKSVEDLLKQNSFDVVYYHLIRSSQYLSKIQDKSCLNIIDFTDAVSLYLSRMFEQEKNYIKKIFIRTELKRIKNYENIAEKFDALFICSEIDRQFLIDKGIKQDIQILNNGIDTDYFVSEQNDYDFKRIIFTGNMPYYANSDAVIYFTKDILPLITKKDPEVRFYIVGQHPPLMIKKLASENVIVTGYVKDIRAEYLKSAVNVAPMRFGAGTLNKVLESIALGIPVVATSISMLGLPKELAKFVFIADTPAEFANTVLEVINNPSIRNELMVEGKTIISKTLSWNNIVSDFEFFLKNKLKEKNRSLNV